MYVISIWKPIFMVGNLYANFQPISEGKSKVFNPKRSQKPKPTPKMTEYQLAFQWNNPFKPLIRANTNQVHVPFAFY